MASSPLFDSVRAAWLPWAPRAEWPALADYQALLTQAGAYSGGGAAVQVAPQPIGVADDWRMRYEARIYRSGELPTRAGNWHDFFNVLAWASFPRAKAALNARHYASLEAQADAGQAKTRIAPQDALTQFDETGVVVISSDPALLELIRAFRWKELFWVRRDEVRARMRCLLFGHGLMEKSLAPYVGMTGKGILLTAPPETLTLPLPQFMTRVDGALAAVIAGLAHPRELAPVPVLGFPGFFEANQAEAFFDNHTYFRLPRSAP